jgi:TetR/AcrR family transcriptional regulator
MARPARVSPGRILAAAAAEFAACGYAGARVDRIARRARVNKAMLYYHFRSKQGLYRALLADTFGRAGSELRRAAEATADPGRQLDAVIAALAGFIRGHRFLASIMLREIAEGGAHLDAATLASLAALPQLVGGIIQRGIQEEAFRPVHPLAAYFTMLAPTVMYLAGEPIRKRLAREHLVSGPPLTHEAFVHHIQDTMRRALSRTGGASRRDTP